MAILAPAIPGTFEEAIAWAKARGAVLPEEFYSALRDEAKGRAFTVSGLAGLEQIQRTLASLNTALEVGESFENWRERFGPEVELPGAHLETVFRNFMQTAYNAGRWAQIRRNAGARPYVQFVAIDDGRTTDVCRQHNGIVRAVDDPFWKGKHCPPLHHNCRSRLRSLSAEQAAKIGRAPAPTETPPPGWGHNPAGEDAAAGLAQAIADKSRQLPRPWLSVLAAFFVGGWAAVGAWIGRVFG